MSVLGQNIPKWTCCAHALTKTTRKQHENNTPSSFSGKKDHCVLLDRQLSTATNACDAVASLVKHVHLCTAFLVLQFNDQQAFLAL